MGCDDDNGYGDRERKHQDRLEKELLTRLNELGFSNPNFLRVVRLICHDHEFGTRR